MFEVDKAGLANLMERRGKFFAVGELLGNAWDSGTPSVSVTLTPIPGQAYAELAVEDWGEGFADLKDAYTLFGRSRRGSDASKRGRFSLGEKLVLACCRAATIETIGGSIHFASDGTRRNGRTARNKGTRFVGEIKMTRDEYEQVKREMWRIIPPVDTTFNGEQVRKPDVVEMFHAKLPTEVADSEGTLRRSIRQTEIEFCKDEAGPGQILEMGIPVVETENGYRINVLQKVPLNMERDNVQPSYLRTLEALLLNHVADQLTSDEATQPWAQEAAGDSRALPDTVKTVIQKRFGERAVVATPNDPIANAQAAANGYTVIAGGALSANTWANIKKHGTLKAASQAFPSLTPEQRTAAAQANAGKCPMCGK